MNNIHIHAFAHSLPHRGPGASRARTRWQPYASTLAASGTQRSPSLYLPTPASSIASTSPPTAHLCTLDHLKPYTQQTPVVNPLRDSQKTKYAAQLVDQAVKTLCETWHPDDIPTVFTSCGREGGRESLCAQPESPPSRIPSAAPGLSTLFSSRNTQLPSPVSPTSPQSQSQVSSPSGDRCESYLQAPNHTTSNLVPIKGFVHEVLRRSRTSTGVLQTALCYLEAIRSKVPERLRAEKARPTSGLLSEQAPEPRIIPGLFEEYQSFNTTGVPTPFDEAVDTVRIGDTVLVADLDVDVPTYRSGRREEAPLPPLPPLPSPLCCPRRTFLACLILASKFMQDRSYSNRAWAKLAGLPPREIGRCERALGEALEWRLWVGKTPSPALTSGSSSGRTVSRSRSDNDILRTTARTCSSASTAAWAASTTAGALPPASSAADVFSNPPPRDKTRGLQRSATVPVGGFDRSVENLDSIAALSSNFNGSGYYHDTRAAPGTGYDATFAMDVEPQVEVSPSLSTPTLSYSPMSSASSSSDGSEERTIQMSMIMDLSTPSLSSFGMVSNSGAPWVASSYVHTPANPANPYGSYNPYLSRIASVELYCTEPLSGPILPAMNPPDVKQVPITLPSFSTTFANSCPGVFGPSAQ